jgi:hypothetical protein
VSVPIDRVHSEFGPSQPGRLPGPPARPSLPWAAGNPKTDDENWRYIRRVEIANFAIPFMIHLVRDGELSHSGAEPWKPEGPSDDAAIVARAVRLAGLLQDAVDKARPRA